MFDSFLVYLARYVSGYLQNNIECDCLDTLLNALKLAFSPQWDLSQLQAQISNVHDEH